MSSSFKKLDRGTVETAIAMIHGNRDGDLFPPLPEFDALYASSGTFVDLITKKGISEYEPQPCRRFFVPKDDQAFRLATQLHPQDSVILTSILLEYGNLIEDRRQSKERAFAYRFDPQVEYGLYGKETGWSEFWSSASELAAAYKYVVYCDIADFYNQIYHHVVENQLAECGLPNQAIKWIRNLLKATTEAVSRGIPVGPHGSHLLAECTLIPIDNSLYDQGLTFIRYADDILVFCQSKREVRQSLLAISRTLDRQQRLTLQHKKTHVYDASLFPKVCAERKGDQPKSEEERVVLEVIKRHTEGDPYVFIMIELAEDEGAEIFTEEVLARVIEGHLEDQPIDFARLRWFFKRLAQTGHYAALKVMLTNVERLEPCLSSICSYIGHINGMPPEWWDQVADRLLATLDDTWLGDSDFSRLSVVSLFARQVGMKHFASLAREFEMSNGHERREILLAAHANGAVDWLRERKEDCTTMDAWQRMAYLFGVSLFPREERKFFLRRQQRGSEFEEWLIRYSMTYQAQEEA